jgi:HAD superfamily hydrolase (TIGR01549 family)
LRTAHTAGLRVGVVSNIAWDIRPVFQLYQADTHVDEYALSYVEGAAKPDVKLFRIACERLGVAPEQTLMIGDSAEADGAAAQIGCATVIVEQQTTTDRPDALLTALAAHGLAR